MGLLFVGAVLILNGLHLLGIGNNRDVSVFNFLTGGLTLLIALWWAFGGTASAGEAFDAAGTLLFSFTYLWIGANMIRGVEDERSFGWYCGFVAVVATPTGYLVWQDGDVGLALLWWLWAILWGAFFVLSGLERNDLTRPIAGYTIVVGVLTAAAGYIMSAGFWPWPT
jgi:hypothetical protein